MTKNFVRATYCAVLLVIVAGLTTLPASAAPIYVQPTDFNGAFASQNDTTGGFGNFATAFDNFTLGGSYSLNSVQWVGSYFNPSTLAPITGFTVSFYADSGGAPGALLWTSGDVAGNAGETFIGFDLGNNPTYAYSMGVSFAAAGGTTYWLSIVPDLGFPPQWGWETGVGGDGAAYQCFLGSCGAVSSDLAFALSTPEPSSMVFLATGLVALGIRVRNRMS
jgi:hypothetical protein